MYPKTSTNVKRCYSQAKRMYFFIWDKISSDFKKEFDRKPVYKKKIENQNKILR